MPSSHTSNNMDFIRIVAASLVLISHGLTLHGGEYEPLYYVTGSLSLGDLGVDIFFTLSGFLIAKSWQSDPHILRFVARRMLRILPALYAYFILSTLLIGPIFTVLPINEYFSTPNIHDFLWQFDVFDLQGTLPGVTLGYSFPTYINGSLWSLKVEAALYFITLALGVLTVVSSKLLSMVVAIASFTLYIYTQKYMNGFHHALGMDLTMSADVASYFFSGAALSLFWKANQKWNVLFDITIFSVLVLIGGSAFPILLHLFLPFLILNLSFYPTKYLSRFGSSGDYSYSMYIYSFPVEQTISHFLGQNSSIILYLAIAFAGTMILAALSWHSVEKPFLSFKPGHKAVGIIFGVT